MTAITKMKMKVVTGDLRILDIPKGTKLQVIRTGSAGCFCRYNGEEVYLFYEEVDRKAEGEAHGG